MHEAGQALDGGGGGEGGVLLGILDVGVPPDSLPRGGEGAQNGWQSRLPSLTEHYCWPFLIGSSNSYNKDDRVLKASLTL